MPHGHQTKAKERDKFTHPTDRAKDSHNSTQILRKLGKDPTQQHNPSGTRENSDRYYKISPMVDSHISEFEAVNATIMRFILGIDRAPKATPIVDNAHHVTGVASKTLSHGFTPAEFKVEYNIDGNLFKLNRAIEITTYEITPGKSNINFKIYAPESTLVAVVESLTQADFMEDPKSSTYTWICNKDGKITGISLVGKENTRSISTFEARDTINGKNPIDLVDLGLARMMAANVLCQEDDCHQKNWGFDKDGKIVRIDMDRVFYPLTFPEIFDTEPSGTVKDRLNTLQKLAPNDLLHLMACGHPDRDNKMVKREDKGNYSPSRSFVFNCYLADFDMNEIKALDKEPKFVYDKWLTCFKTCMLTEENITAMTYSYIQEDEDIDRYVEYVNHRMDQIRETLYSMNEFREYILNHPELVKQAMNEVNIYNADINKLGKGDKFRYREINSEKESIDIVQNIIQRHQMIQLEKALSKLEGLYDAFKNPIYSSFMNELDKKIEAITDAPGLEENPDSVIDIVKLVEDTLNDLYNNNQINEDERITLESFKASVQAGTKDIMESIFGLPYQETDNKTMAEVPQATAEMYPPNIGDSPSLLLDLSDGNALFGDTIPPPEDELHSNASMRP